MNRARVVSTLILTSIILCILGCSAPSSNETPTPEPLQVSDLPEDIIRHITGADYVDFHNAQVEGTKLVLNPTGGGDIAWAMYQIDESPDIRPREMVFRVEAETETEYWVGLANYTLGTWEMIEGNSAEDLVINLYESWDIYRDSEDVLTYIVGVPADERLTLVEVESRSNTYYSFEPAPAPGWITASDGDYPDRIKVSWEQVQYCLYYRIERADSLGGEPVDGSWKPVSQTPQLSFIDMDVAAGDVYHYRVKGYRSRQFFGEPSAPDIGSTATQ